ncbi:uncharacterized protein LOC144750060 [Ciona intestinalis]
MKRINTAVKSAQLKYGDRRVLVTLKSTFLLLHLCLILLQLVQVIILQCALLSGIKLRIFVTVVAVTTMILKVFFDVLQHYFVSVIKKLKTDLKVSFKSEIQKEYEAMLVRILESDSSGNSSDSHSNSDHGHHSNSDLDHHSNSDHDHHSKSDHDHHSNSDHDHHSNSDHGI